MTEKHPTHAVIDCNGVGYVVQISLNTFARIPDVERCRLLVHLSVKEDSLSLFGFADEDERRLFRNLISVSGIGESTARMMLSSLSPAEIQNAIISGNVPVLQSIKGIGNKTAQRLVIDLKDKLGKSALTEKLTGTQVGPENNQVKEQAMSALLTLGFGKPAVEKVLGNILRTESNLQVEQVIKMALNQL